MKRKALAIVMLALCFCLCLALASCGEPKEIAGGEGVMYELSDDGTYYRAQITPSSMNYDPSIDGELVKNVIVEAEIDGIPIKEVVTYVSSGEYDHITEITVPGGITKIYNRVSFEGLKRFNFLGTVEEWLSIDFDGNMASFAEEVYISGKKVTDIVVPKTVTVLQDGILAMFKSLKSITLHDGITSIGISAFCECESLTEITIPKGVTSISNYAFYGCKSLKKVVLSEGIKAIGEYAFEGCTSLESIVLPSTLEEINEYAFNGCTSLESVIIPESVTKIGDSAFNDCEILTINCKAESQPSGWDTEWNSSSCPVVWDYCEHRWVGATCTEAMICEICDKTEGEALGHSYLEGICTVCGESDPDYVEVKLDIVGSEITKEQWEEMRNTDNFTVRGESVDGEYQNEYIVNSNAAYMKVGPMEMYYEKVGDTCYSIMYIQGMGMVGGATEPIDTTIQGMLLSIEMDADTFDLMTFNSEKGCYVYEFKDATIQGGITDQKRSGIYEFYFVDGVIAAMVLVDDENEEPQIVYLTDVGTTGDVEIPEYSVIG